MSKLFNFISWILLIGGLAGILLIGTDHLSENFTSLVAAAMLLANWMKVLFLWRQNPGQPLRKLHIFELIAEPIAILFSLYAFWIVMSR